MGRSNRRTGRDSSSKIFRSTSTRRAISPRRRSRGRKRSWTRSGISWGRGNDGEPSGARRVASERALPARMPSTMIKTNQQLPKYLADMQREVEGYAREYGLDFFETVFEVLDYQRMNEVA